jgi:hypothetical protein
VHTACRPPLVLLAFLQQDVLSLIKRDAMKASGRVTASFASHSLHSWRKIPPPPPSVRPSVRCTGGVLGPTTGLHASGKKRILLLSKLEPQIFGRPAPSFSGNGRGGSRYKVPGAGRPEEDPGSGYVCVYFFLSRQYHYQPTVPINPFRPAQVTLQLTAFPIWRKDF